jgi:hypothetical protein
MLKKCFYPSFWCDESQANERDYIEQSERNHSLFVKKESSKDEWPIYKKNSSKEWNYCIYFLNIFGVMISLCEQNFIIH